MGKAKKVLLVGPIVRLRRVCIIILIVQVAPRVAWGAIRRRTRLLRLVRFTRLRAR